MVTVTPDETEFQTGVAITPAVTVKDGDTVLTEGTDYTLSGTSEGAAVKYGTSADNCSPGESTTFTDAGEYVVYYEIAKDGDKTEKGSAKVVIHEAEQVAPDVSATDETIKGKADGSIVGITPAMEYRREGMFTGQ